MLKKSTKNIEFNKFRNIEFNKFRNFATGVVVETNYSYYTLMLTSWSIYKDSEPAIPGYSWMILVIALIGTISYIIKRIQK